MIVCDYDELVKALREHAEWMGPNNYELPISMYDDLMRAANALERLGPFGRLLVQYCGDPRGPAGRSGLPIEQEVLMQKPIEDVDGGKWIPVNAGALQVLAEAYKKLLAKDTNVPAKWISTKDRLPCDEKPVLACYGFDGSKDANRRWYGVLTYFAFETNPHWQHETTGLHVTHWMPLPELPREEFADET